MKDWQIVALGLLGVAAFGGGYVLMKLSDSGVALLESEESFSATPYQDEAGIWTIGYGHKIKPGEQFTTISREQAQTILEQDVAEAEATIRKLVRVPLTQSQFDALTSFVYNVGVAAFAGSTMLKMLNAKNYAGASTEFARWRYIHKNGVLVASSGLSDRRAREQQLFNAQQAVA